MTSELILSSRSLPRDCLYPSTTEKNHDKVIAQLSRVPSHGEAVLGVSGLSTLNIASVREGITDIYVFDLANSVSHFWKKIVPILAECEDQELAVQKIEEELISSRAIYFEQMQLISPYNKLPLEERLSKAVELAVDHFRAEREQGISFLSDPLRYSRIHNLAKEGRIHFYQADLANSGNVNKIISFFRESRVVFDTIYLSNIGDSITDLRSLEAFSKFRKGLCSLIPFFSPHYIEVNRYGYQSITWGRGERVEVPR